MPSLESNLEDSRVLSVGRQAVRGAALFGLGAVAAAILWSARPMPAQASANDDLTFANPNGVVRTVATHGAIDRDNPFFKELGTNGRTCATCHRAAQAWTITPSEIQERFERTSGLDPLFRTNDGSNCAGADIGTLERRREAFSLLLAKGLIRIGLNLPADAEFEVLAVDDPYACGGPPRSLSLYRRPLPTANLNFLSAVMWDGRAAVPGRGMDQALAAQAFDAIVSHAQAASARETDLREIVSFEKALVVAQARDRAAGSLTAAGARGGPDTLVRQPFCLGINDPLRILPSTPGSCLAASTGLDPAVFRLFDAWLWDESPARQAIARGENLFNTRRFVIDQVPGLNGGTQDPLSKPIETGTCTVCHDAPNAGNHSVSMPLNIGIATASRRTPDLPLYTLRNKATGDVVQTTDPGRAMITGRWKDIAKFKGPILRALAARAPYFHDGSAASLADVVEFYNTRFNIGLTEREKADLLAFLQAL
jgi:cytochrome c peroxidase